MAQQNAGEMSAAELFKIMQARANGHTWDALADAHDRPSGEALRAAVKRAIARVSRMDGDGAGDPVEAEAQRQARIASLREERELTADIAAERSLRRAVEEQLERIVPKLRALKPIAAPAPRSGVQGRESLLKQWSDWHAGELVSAERTRGFNAYDWPTFVQRLQRDTESTIHLAQMLTAGGWAFDELVLAVLGDLVSGTIHELERHSDKNNIVETVVDVAGEAAKRIEQLAQVFPKLRIFWLSGNHGRLPDARRVQQKDPTRSWDAMIGMIVQKLVAKHEHVSIVVPNAYSVAFDVQGHTFLGSHGHDIKSWNQIPFYGISRYVTSINALEAARNKAIKYFLFAHFHNPASLTMPGSEYFINGSLIGGTEYGVNALGRVDRPCQWMMGVHRKHGVTHRWPVYCTDEGSAA